MIKKAFRWLQNPRFRHGLGAVAVTAALIVLCILANVIFSTLEDTYGWYQDMSFNGYATTSEETQQLLSQMEEDVELYLLYQNGDVDESLHQVLKNYALLTPHLSVKVTDIAQNPGILTRFTGSSTTDVAADTIIVNCPSTGRYEVVGYNDFLTASYDSESGSYVLSGLAYEKKLTQAILSVSRENVASVGILQGHAELTEDALSTFIQALESKGCEVHTVNLLKGDTLEGLNLLVIASPVNDLTTGEVESLSAYAKEGGSFFITRDYTDKLDQMPNYLSFLNNYGITPLSGVVVAGKEDTGSYYENQIYLLPYMTDLDMLLPLTQAGEDVLLMPAACAFETPTEGDTSLSVGTVLKSGPHAYLRSLEDDVDSIEKQPGDPEGEFSLALYARRMHTNGNISRVFISGSSLLFTEEYIYQRSYSEAFLGAILDELVGDSELVLDIAPSLAVRPALTAGSQLWGILLPAALVLLIACMGLLILLPRYRK